MNWCSLPCLYNPDDPASDKGDAWHSVLYPTVALQPYMIPWDVRSQQIPTSIHTGKLTRNTPSGYNVNFVVPEDMQEYGTLDGASSAQYNFIQTAQVVIDTPNSTSVTTDNTKIHAIPNENCRFMYWTFGEGFADDLKGKIVPDNYVNTFEAKNYLTDYAPDGATFEAHFTTDTVTPKAVYTADGAGNGKMTFYYDDVDHSTDTNVIAVYPVVPNTSDYNLPAWYRNSMESWTYGDSHPIPKFQPEIEQSAKNGITVEFDDSFAEYTELRSMSCWFMGTMSADEKSMYNGFAKNGVVSIDFSNVPTQGLRNVAYMFGGHEVFSDHMGSSITGINISNLYAENMENMNFMFANCVNLTSLKFDNVNTKDVKSMKGMFYNCRAISEDVCSAVLSQLNTSSVEDMSYMFARYVSYEEKYQTELDPKLTHIVTFNLPDNFSTSSVTNMEGMFSGISTMSKVIINGQNFDTSKVTNMNSMFANNYFMENVTVNAPK